MKPLNQQQENDRSIPAIKGVYRVANANEGSLWLKEAVVLVKQSPGSWIGVAAFLMFLLILPMVNLIATILMPIALGGIMLGCRSQQANLGFKFDHLFEGLKHDARELLILSGFYALALLAVNLLTHALLLLVGIDYQDVIANMTPQANMTTDKQMFEWFAQLQEDGTLFYLALGMLVSLVLLIPVLMALWFAPALVVFQKMTALKALHTSFKACHYNFKAFLVYGLIGFGYLMMGYFLMITVAVILPLLGLPLFLFSFFVLFAISLATIYPSYISLFENENNNQLKPGENQSDSSMLA